MSNNPVDGSYLISRQILNNHITSLFIVIDLMPVICF